MNFRVTLLLSIILHLALALLISRTPEEPVLDLAEVQIVELKKAGTHLPSRPRSESTSSTSLGKNLPAKSEGANALEAPGKTAALSSEAGSEAGEDRYEPVNLGTVTMAPKILQKKRIPYPRSAERAGIEGVVDLKIVVDTKGRVQEAEVVRGPGFGLNEAALAAVKECLFSPARVGDRPVAVQMIYKYEFRIGEQ